MTISTETNLAVYQGNGATTVFAFPFYVLEEGDLEIQLQAAGSGTVTHTYVSGEYTLSGVGDPAGGSVTILGTPITSDYKLTIERVLPYTQPLDLVNETGFYPDEVEKQFDRDVMQTQQLKRLIDAAITVPKGETGFTLPAASTRASKYLAFDAGGDLVTVVGTSSDPAVTANMLRVTSRAALKALNVTLYALAFLDHVSGGVFKLRQGAMPTDVQEGIYIASNTATYYWEREWDGIHGKPEWFHDGGADYLAALNACIALCPVVDLAARDYTISDTWLIQTENRTVRGSARFNRTSGTGSRITLADATKDIIRVGYSSQPGGAPEQDALGAGFLKNVTLENLAIWRGTAPAPWGDINNANTVGIGLKVIFVLKCRFNNLLVQNSALGVYAGGTIYTKFDDVEARLDIATTAGNYDTARGWYLDGNNTFGYAGGNASVYLNRCVGVAGRKSVGASDAVIPIGLVAKGPFVDSFIDHFEVAGTSKGMVFDGTGAGAFGTVDLYVSHPIVDQYDTYGIEINNINQAAIELVAPYIAWNGSGTVGLVVAAGSGFTMLGGQIIGGNAMVLADLSNSIITGVKIRESEAPVVMTGCDSVKLEVQCNNRTSTATQAVNMTNCARCKVEPYVIAASTAPTNFNYGINLASGNTNCTLDVTGVAINATTDRIRTGGGGGSGITTQGDVSGHVIINPGEGPML